MKTPVSVISTMKAISFKFGINPKWPGDKLPYGDPRWGEHTASFRLESHTIDSLTERVAEDGYAFAAVMRNGYRNEANFLSAQRIGLDDDRGTSESSLESLTEDPFIADYGALLYSSPTSSTEHPKSRIVFILDEPFTDPAAYRTTQEAMWWMFGATDPQVKEPARFFYGRPNADHITLGNVLYRDIFQEQVIEPYLESLGNAENGYKPAEPIGETVPEGIRKHTDVVRMRPNWLPGLVSHRTLLFSFKCQLPSLLHLRHRETKRRIRRGTEEVVAEWQRLLDDGVVKNRAELARRMGVSRARVTRTLAHT